MFDFYNTRFLVRNEQEYVAITTIAARLGYCWNSGSSLKEVHCSFPTVLYFNEQRCVTFSRRVSDYDYTVSDLIPGSLRNLIEERRVKRGEL